MQTDSGARGQFARFVVQVNLAEPFVSKIHIAKRIHHVEYKSLPSICFVMRDLGILRRLARKGRWEKSQR